MKELPYFRFTSQEWQNGMITLESMEDQGVFINACSYYWLSNCSITIAVLKQRLKGYEKSIDTLIEKEIIYDNGGNITIGFLDEQWGDLKEYREKKQIAGRKGGLKKSSNAKAQLKHNSSYKDKDKDKKKDKDNITEVITIFNSITKKSFKTTSEKTRKLVQARINDGYKKEDFERVIKYKNEKWKYNDEMKAYIRPETLLSNKFESYLNECPKPKKPGIKHAQPDIPFEKPTAEDFEQYKQQLGVKNEKEEPRK